jgi:hypothetical protein
MQRAEPRLAPDSQRRSQALQGESHLSPSWRSQTQCSRVGEPGILLASIRERSSIPVELHPPNPKETWSRAMAWFQRSLITAHRIHARLLKIRRTEPEGISTQNAPAPVMAPLCFSIVPPRHRHGFTFDGNAADFPSEDILNPEARFWST